VSRAVAALFFMTACCTAAAAAPGPHLTKSNFKEVGDAITDLLDMRMLAMAHLVISQRNPVPAPHRASFGRREQPAQDIAFETDCAAGGSVTGTIIDSDADGTVSPGDRFATSFHGCRFDADGEAYTGRSGFTVSRHVTDETDELTEFHYRFDDFGTESLRWAGAAHVAFQSNRRTGGDHVVVDYIDLTVQRRARAWLWNVRFDIWRSPVGDRTTSMSGALSLGRLSLKLAQIEPFFSPRGATPQAGLLTANDTEGNLLHVDASESRDRYRYFRHGDEGTTPSAVHYRKKP
jgi:hypothetical protein